MKPDELSKQKIFVLQYFIQNESWVMMGIPPEHGLLLPDKETGKDRFYSYPKRIEDDLKGKYSSISREWAGKICKDLEALGILGHHMFRAARQKNTTEHYFLRSGTAPFKAVMKLVLDKSVPVQGYICITQEYIRHHISEDLVKDILAEKNVVMERNLTILDWAPVESKKVHALYYERKGSTDSKSGKDSANNPYARSFDSCVTEIVRKSNGKINELSPYIQPGFFFRFPVLKAGISDDEKNRIIGSENEKIFKEYPGLDQYHSAIQEHYEHFQRDHWILPILALIRSSRNTLGEFLFGDWKPYDRTSGIKSMDYPIFTFLFTTINDVARRRDVPDESVIPSIRFRPDFRRSHNTHSRPALLEVQTNLNLTVCYDASFDTEHLFYGAENGDVWENDTEQNYDVSTWIEIGALGIKINKENIRDFALFVSSLLDTTNPISRRILERLSHRMQHLLSSYQPIQNEFPSWGDSLLNELNRMLSNLGFYDPIAFSNITLTEEGRGIAERSGVYGRYDYNSFYHSMIFGVNRVLFDEAYPELVQLSKNLEDERKRMIVKK